MGVSDSGIFTTVDAISPFCDPNNAEVIKVDVPKNLFAGISKSGERTRISEFYGIVEPGLILAKHCWRDLKRGLYADGDMDASCRVFIYSRKPPYSYIWKDDVPHGRLIRVPAPDNKVFVVLVKRYLEGSGNSSFGCIVRWNWIKESRSLAQAPIDHDERYEEPCWSIEQ